MVVYVAVLHNVLQCVAACCSVLQRVKNVYRLPKYLSNRETLYTILGKYIDKILGKEYDKILAKYYQVWSGYG